jgi:hypothetical protein
MDRGRVWCIYVSAHCDRSRHIGVERIGRMET